MGRRPKMPKTDEYRVRTIVEGLWILEKQDKRGRDGYREVARGPETEMRALWSHHSQRRQKLFRLDREVDDAMEAYAKDHGLFQQDVFDLAIREFLANKGYTGK